MNCKWISTLRFQLNVCVPKYYNPRKYQLKYAFLQIQREKTIVSETKRFKPFSFHDFLSKQFMSSQFEKLLFLHSIC